MRLSIEQAKKYLQGMHRLWLCDEWGQPYNSKQCKNCDSHDNCLDIVLSSGSMSDIAKDLLDTIEALQQENEQLQAQVAKMREALECVESDFVDGVGIVACAFCGKENAKERGHHEFCVVGKALTSIDTTDYHNPADVEALKKAREALITTIKGIDNKKIIPANTDAAIELWRHKQQIQEALTEIDKALGGKEDV